jgi:hypothetical protein
MDTHNLASEIMLVILRHPSCSRGLGKDSESIVGAIEHHIKRALGRETPTSKEPINHRELNAMDWVDYLNEVINTGNLPEVDSTVHLRLKKFIDRNCDTTTPPQQFPEYGCIHGSYGIVLRHVTQGQYFCDAGLWSVFTENVDGNTIVTGLSDDRLPSRYIGKEIIPASKAEWEVANVGYTNISDE